MSVPVGPKALLKELLRSKSGLAGIAILVGLIVLSIAVVTMYPYDVVRAWNDPLVWQKNPRLAAPEWSEIFIGKHLPRNIELSENDFIKTVTPVMEGMRVITLEGSWYFSYDEPPSEITLFLTSIYEEKRPHLTVKFVRPDGEEVELYSAVISTRGSWTLHISISDEVKSRIARWLKSKGIVLKQIIPYLLKQANS